MNTCGNRSTKCVIAAKGHMNCAVHLLIFQHYTRDSCLVIGTNAEFAEKATIAISKGVQ
ncbi:hypothetical protein D3C74_465980 [compost metagenome]